METINHKPGYLSLCYHYVRVPRERDPYVKLMATRIPQFEEHIEMLQRNFAIITPDDAIRFSRTGDGAWFKSKYGVLFTFDDGLSDHYTAARILAKHHIAAHFFIPTCVLKDNEPANPTILHYALALFRLPGVLPVYHNALESERLSVREYGIRYNRNSDNPWETISELKKALKYRIDHKASRRILLFIYDNLLKKHRANILQDMHLSHVQVREMLEMGHTIGAHSHTHISLGSANLNSEEFHREVIAPQKYLEEVYDTKVDAFSYPYGKLTDCFEAEHLVRQTNVYQVAYTVEQILNTRDQSPFELGRYMPQSTDDAASLERVLVSIIQKNNITAL